MRNYTTSAYAACNKAKAEVDAAEKAVVAATKAREVAADRCWSLLQAARAGTKAVVDAIADVKRAADKAEDAVASTIRYAKFTVAHVVAGTYDEAHFAYKNAYRKSADASDACDAACKAFRTVYEAANGYAIPWAATPRANAQTKRKAAAARRAINISTEAAAKAAKAADSPVAMGALEAAARTLDAVSYATTDAIYARHAANEAVMVSKNALFLERYGKAAGKMGKDE